MASQVCTEKGKKTLNVDHVIQALKQLNLDSHIKKMSSELDISAVNNEEKMKELTANAKDMKNLINKKKIQKIKKKAYQYDEAAAKEQEEMLRKAELNVASLYSQQSQEIPSSGINLEEGGSLKTENNKKMRLESIEEELFAKGNIQEEENFD